MSRFLQLVLDMFDGATTKALQGLGTDKRSSPKKRQPRQPKRLKPQSLMGGLHRDAEGWMECVAAMDVSFVENRAIYLHAFD